MKGIILAGGNGTRLYPLTFITSKQLLPIYDKPMIYYSLSVLMLAKIKDILIISTPNDLPKMEQLLGDGKRFGIRLSYISQEKPEGLAQAFTIGEEFIGNEPVAMILGDNFFYGAGMIDILNEAKIRAENGVATIFGYKVNDPERFGVVEIDDNNVPISIVEKPKKPKSNYCVTGLYFYPSGVSKNAYQIKKSDRNEFEITDLNNIYLLNKKLYVCTLGRGYAWMDAGTFDSLVETANYVKMIEKHQGIKIACLEEIAYVNGWISKNEILKVAKIMLNNDYGIHLKNVANGKIIYGKK